MNNIIDNSNAIFLSKKIFLPNCLKIKPQIIKNISTSLILLILGISLPWCTHIFGLGMNFLPIQLPILAGALLLPFLGSFFLIILTLILNTYLTGMPAVYPNLPCLIIELSIYIVLIKYFYLVKNWNIFLSLLLTLLGGRILTTLITSSIGLVHYQGFIGILQHFKHLILDFLPGIILQLFSLTVLSYLREKIK